jgi:hypothetical protein
VFHNYICRRCTLGAVGAAGGQKIMAVVVIRDSTAAGGPAGLAVGAGIGCVTYLAGYWWN